MGIYSSICSLFTSVCSFHLMFSFHIFRPSLFFKIPVVLYRLNGFGVWRDGFYVLVQKERKGGEKGGVAVQRE